MSYFIDSNGIKVHISKGNIYKYKDFLFEYSKYFLPTQLKKDYKIRLRNTKGFWEALQEFDCLPDQEKEKYRIKSNERKY